MALTETQRHELYELVKHSSLGQAGADLVMNAIPTVNWTDLATHDDLAILRGELRSEMAELRGEMAELRGELRVELSSLETRLQRSIITWILAAQGVTLAAISVLVTVAMVALA